MSEDDRTYFQRRAEAEIERAQSASQQCVVQAHHQLSQAYLEKIAALEPVRKEQG